MDQPPREPREACRPYFEARPICTDECQRAFEFDQLCFRYFVRDKQRCSPVRSAGIQVPFESFVASGNAQ